MIIFQLLFKIILSLAIIVFLFFAVVSLKEKQKRASIVCFSLSTFFILFLLLSLLIDINVFIAYTFNITVILAVAILFIPIRGVKKVENAFPLQFDERQTMFSRAELEPKTEKFNQYYKDYPQDLVKDNVWRAKHGLLSEKSLFFNNFEFMSADASFKVISKFAPYVDGDVNPKRVEYSAKELTKLLSRHAKLMGVHSIGFTKIEDHHIYSIKGRGAKYGEKINFSHPNAIAFTVEMDHQSMKSAPKAAVISESARQYLNSGVIAVQIAELLRGLGYSAKAHIDGNYDLICPLVAESAGLGRIGRMGLLMTPELGPRVRLAVVTTEAPLELNTKEPDFSIDQFCKICKKCARVCPSQAISFDDKEIIDNVKRWRIDSVKCFDYWCLAGTDCGRCMAVCPYSHPNNLAHNFIRFGIKNNFIFRKLAIHLDDFFYGKKPGVKIIES